MITYESLVIQHNLAASKDLYGVAYLSDAFMYSDATPMIVASAGSEERAIFDKWLAYMKSPEAAKQLIGLGLRPASVSLNRTNAGTAFDPAWGIKQSLDIPPITLPEANVVNQLFTAYQTVVRPPYDLRICLDGSSSMSSNGGWNQLVQSLDILLHQDKAAQDQLLMNARDLTSIRIFNEGARYTSPTIAGAEYAALGKAYNDIKNNVGGDTAMYDCIRWALGGFQSTPADSRMRLLVVMTDGQSNAGGGLNDIPAQLRSANARVILVGFSTAPDMRQLHSVADPANGLIIVTEKDIKANDKSWNVYLASSLVDAMKTAFGSK